MIDNNHRIFAGVYLYILSLGLSGRHTA